MHGVYKIAYTGEIVGKVGVCGGGRGGKEGGRKRREMAWVVVGGRDGSRGGLGWVGLLGRVLRCWLCLGLRNINLDLPVYREGSATCVVC